MEMLVGFIICAGLLLFGVGITDILAGYNTGPSMVVSVSFCLLAFYGILKFFYFVGDYVLN